MNPIYHRVVVLALGAALGGLVSSVAWADGPSCRGEGPSMIRKASHERHGHGSIATHILRHLLRHKQDLDLTDVQITKLRSLALDADRAGIRAQAEVKVTERELRAMMWDEKAELSAIEAKVKEHESFEATARIIGIRAKRDLFGVLTPEQRAKQKTLWENMRHGSHSSMRRAEAGDQADLEESTENSTNEMEFSLTSGDPSVG
jgi:protein CpxP